MRTTTFELVDEPSIGTNTPGNPPGYLLGMNFLRNFNFHVRPAERTIMLAAVAP
jgi:hypothetical protein